MIDLGLEAQKFLSKGDYRVARERFQLMIAKGTPGDSTQVEAFLGLGICDREEAQMESAILNFEKSIALCPSLAAIENLIFLYQKVGRIKEVKGVAAQGLQLRSVSDTLKAKYLDLISSHGNA